MTAAVVLALSAGGLAGSAGATTVRRERPTGLTIQLATTAAAQASTRRFWTSARMIAAQPGELLATSGRAAVIPTVISSARRARSLAISATLARLSPGRLFPARLGAAWAGGGAVVKTTGKVFFTLTGVDAGSYVCSGSAVTSGDKSTVLTAGHCVTEGGRVYAKNWLFVPGYVNGKAPYGSFAATSLTTTTEWATAQDFNNDVAFANVAKNAAGKFLTDAVGGQSITFNGARGRQTYAFGYPQETPFNGQKLIYCSGAVRQDTTTLPTTDQGLKCTMTPGSSGGPWFTNFNVQTGKGTLTSVTSFSYSNLASVLWGPYLGSTAKALFTSVSTTTAR